MDELDEYRTLILKGAKNLIVKDENFIQQRFRLNESAAQRQKETGNYWDFKYTNLERQYWQSMITRPGEMRDRIQPYKDNLAKCWRQEVAAFEDGFVEDLLASGKRIPSASSICKQIMVLKTKELGLAFDKEVSSSGQMAFSRTLNGSLKLSFIIDLPNLRIPLGHGGQDVRTGEDTPPTGPIFYAWLELRDASTPSEPALARIMFDWLFPIREFPLGFRCYSDFYQLRELEALLHMHLAMYRIISPDLDEAMEEVDR